MTSRMTSTVAGQIGSGHDCVSEVCGWRGLMDGARCRYSKTPDISDKEAARGIALPAGVR